jgi:hypothetical protein
MSLIEMRHVANMAYTHVVKENCFPFVALFRLHSSLSGTRFKPYTRNLKP